MNDPENVKELFARYARLRQARTSREEAWNRIKPDTEKLIDIERKRVMALIRDWEIIEGHRYKSGSADDPHATMFNPPAGLREARERLKEQQAFQARLKAEFDRDQTKEVVLKNLAHLNRIPADPATTDCSICQHPNPPETSRCINCGAELSRTRDVMDAAERLRAIQEARQSPQNLPEMALRLEFVDTNQVLRVALTLEQMVIGRGAAGGLMPPDINLAAYDAQAKGVSRYHASLQRRGESLLLTDLQSMNYTYINGQRLYPHEVRALHDGDMLRLGQLMMRVSVIKL